MDWISVVLMAPEVVILGVILVGGLVDLCSSGRRVVDGVLRRRMARRAWPKRL
jgi:hypothetical protein